MVAEVERIAKGLSEAQRNAVAFDMRGYHDPNTVRSLRSKGLVMGAVLTERGLAVRDYLLNNPNA